MIQSRVVQWLTSLRVTRYRGDTEHRAERTRQSRQEEVVKSTGQKQKGTVISDMIPSAGEYPKAVQWNPQSINQSRDWMVILEILGNKPLCCLNSPLATCNVLSWYSVIRDCDYRAKPKSICNPQDVTFKQEIVLHFFFLLCPWKHILKMSVLVACQSVFIAIKASAI